jgi:hypothetical protein
LPAIAFFLFRRVKIAEWRLRFDINAYVFKLARDNNLACANVEVASKIAE